STKRCIMPSYLAFTAKPGCEDQINKAYAKQRGDKAAWLVYSEKIIKEEIEFIQSPEGAGSYSHVRSQLHTVEDWNKIFPDYACGSGFIRINPRGVDNTFEVNEVAKFLITHRHLFAKIEGLDALCNEVLEVCGIRKPKAQAA